MISIVRFLLVLLALGTSLAAFQETARFDAKVLKDIEAKQKELASAQTQQKSANDLLQDKYSRWSSNFQDYQAADNSKILAELTRVLRELADAARANPPSAGKVPARVLEKELPKALDRLEDDFLSALKNRIRRLLPKVFEDPTLVSAEIDGGRLARGLYRLVFESGIEFHVVWNGDIAPHLPDVKTYVDASRLVQKIEREIQILQDPRLAYVYDAPEGMSRIPAGAYVVDATFGAKRPKKKTVRVKSFFIDLHEVTHEEYWSLFWTKIDDKNKRDLRLPRDRDKKPLWVQDEATGEFRPAEAILQHPVTGIDAESALAYAISQKKRLPTEAEWVAAGSANPKGGESLYPWGDKYIEKNCNDKLAGLGTTTTVDAFPDGRSAFGVFNLAGNVREWVATTEKSDKDFTTAIPDGENIVVRGGSYLSPADDVSLKWRWVLPGYYTYEVDLGFRCAQDAD